MLLKKINGKDVPISFEKEQTIIATPSTLQEEYEYYMEKKANWDLEERKLANYLENYEPEYTGDEDLDFNEDD